MELRKLSLNNVWKIINLSVSKEQLEKDFVADNASSIIEAFATREDGYVALPFGLYEDGQAVGFVMIGYGAVGDEDEPDIAAGNYCIWRLMIDEKYQGKHLGISAMEKALEYIKTWPCGKAEYCWLSYEPNNDVAKALYHRMGFTENGEMAGDEVVAILSLI